MRSRVVRHETAVWTSCTGLPGHGTFGHSPAHGPHAMLTSMNRRTNTTGRVLLWLAILLTLGLFSAISYFTVRNNPYYSPYNAQNVISKYRFIEKCKEKVQEQLDQVIKSDAGAPISPEYDSRELVNGVSAKAGTVGWNLSTQVKLSRPGFPTQTVPFGCKSNDKGDVQLAQ